MNHNERCLTVIALVLCAVGAVASLTAIAMMLTR